MMKQYLAKKQATQKKFKELATQFLKGQNVVDELFQVLDNLESRFDEEDFEFLNFQEDDLEGFFDLANLVFKLNEDFRQTPDQRKLSLSRKFKQLGYHPIDKNGFCVPFPKNFMSEEKKEMQ